MDADKQVEAKAAVLAEAANIPLGSLHSVLHSLEKKQLIKTARAGSRTGASRIPNAVKIDALLQPEIALHTSSRYVPRVKGALN